MDVSINDKFNLELEVVQQEKLSDFDAYGLDDKCMNLVILLEIKQIELYVFDTGELYFIDADTFMKFVEVRSIGNKPMYCCQLSHWFKLIIRPFMGHFHLE